MASSSAWPCPCGVSAWAHEARLDGRLNLSAWRSGLRAPRLAGPEPWRPAPTWAGTREGARFWGKWLSLPSVSPASREPLVRV